MNIETSAEAMAGFGAEGRESGEVNDMIPRALVACKNDEIRL